MLIPPFQAVFRFLRSIPETSTAQETLPVLDVVDYVMALEHLDSKLAAIKRVCRALQIKVTTLEVISASDLMDMEFEPHNMLIERLIGRGVYLIAGAPKIGKSWLMLWLAHCVSTGTKVWDFPTQQSDVLYISLEDP